MELYNATDGPNWLKQPNWADAKFTDYDFIDFDWGFIIDLHGLGLSGELPSSLFDLPITEIYLQDNDLQGTLPDNVGKNGLLQVLDVSNNKLTGSLPSSLSNSVNAQISCNNNKMRGTIPQEIVENCLKLNSWILSPQRLGNKFDPIVMADLQEKDVDALRAIYNEMTSDTQNELGWKMNDDPRNWKGVYWNATGHCIGLEMKSISLNKLSSHINDLTSLKLLNLSDNYLKEIPSIASLTELQLLDLSSNHIISLPEGLFMCTNLKLLDFNNNSIAGEIPEEINQLKNLILLDLGINLFTGTVPAMDNLTELMYLSLSELENLDIQPLPKGIAKMKKLQMLFLHEDNFIGIIPESWSELTDLVIFNVEMNHLNGSVEKLFSKMKLLNEVSLNYNTFTGALPEFNEKNTLKDLYLDENTFSGDIPEHWSRLKNIKGIHFKGNAITGNIPAFFGDFEHITYLNCEWNMMSGVLPVEVTNLTYFIMFKWENQDGPGLTLPERQSFVQSATQLNATIPITQVTSNNDRRNEIKTRFAEELRQSLGM